MELIKTLEDERLTGDAILNGEVPVDLVTESLRAALLAKEEAERRACGMRESLEELLGEHQISPGSVVHKRLEAALSSPGCSHKEEAKRLRKAVEWVCAVCDQMERSLIMNDGEKAPWIELRNELRRRAGGPYAE